MALKKSTKKTKKSEVDILKKKLEKISHDYVRNRDSISKDVIGGRCIDCGKYASGAYFQCGHFVASSVGGVLLRYHPRNMHGQHAGCNMFVAQERVKINYTMNMIKKYGKPYVEKLLALKQKTAKADIIFFSKMISLYEEGNEQAIADFLENV